MKVKINSKKISSSSKLNDDINYNVEGNETIEQLKQQLIFGNNSCFLVSGYRGTGKTTLVSRLENEIKDDNVIFVRLNFSKYESYSLILRKLIREIYLTLSSSRRYKTIKDKQLVQSIELLYEHTFYEVFNSSNIKTLKEFSSKLEGSLNGKDIVKHSLPLIAVILSSLNVSFNIFHSLLKNSNVVILMASVCWLIIDGFKIKMELQRKNTSVEELNRKSLYDDEIAEYHLKNILEGLKNEGIKTVFIFDELDKIENDTEIVSIIYDLKPLLLSNLASFIVISGQKLYYKFLSSSILDDSVMTSIFSKNIHISLTDNISLEKLLNSYLMNQEDMNNELLIKYRDSLILNSYRTIRRFINLISQDITWEDGISYLYIDENYEDSYSTDSTILYILTEIIENEINDADYDNGVKDFLTYQLFIWIKKMKFKGKVFFNCSEIFNFEEDYSEIYPGWCKVQLGELCNTLINRLLNIELLEKKATNSEEEFYYRWTSKAKIKIDSINNDMYQNEIKVLEDMIELERYCRAIYLDLEENKQKVEKTKNLMNVIDNMKDMGVVGNEWSDDRFKELYRLSSKIRHGETLSIKEIDEIVKSRNSIRRLIYNLIEGYCFYVINRYLKGVNYNNIIRGYRINLENIRDEIDICAESDSLSNIIFEIKYKNNYSSTDMKIIYILINRLEKYNLVTKKRNKLVLFWFLKESSNSFEKIRNEFNRILNDEYSELSNDIYLFDIALDKTSFNTREMETYLDKVTRDIQNSDIRTNVAVTIDDIMNK